MSRTEMRKRSSFAICVDDRGSDVRLAADRRRVPEPLGDRPHDGGHGALRVPVPLGERDRREQRPTPRPKVLCAELVAEMRLHVLVEGAARQVAPAAVALVAEETAPATRNGEQLADGGRELVVDERRANLRPALAGELQTNAVPADGDVPLAQRRDAVGPRGLRVAVAADAEPPEVDEP